MEDNFTLFDALKQLIIKYDGSNKKYGLRIIKVIRSCLELEYINNKEGKELWDLLYPKYLSYQNNH